MAAAIASVNVLANVHSKRKKIAHAAIIKRLRNSKEAAGLVSLFDKHFQDEDTDGAADAKKDTAPYTARQRWRLAINVTLAMNFWVKVAANKYRHKRGRKRLTANYEKFGQRAEYFRDSNGFTSFVLGCIVVAGILVGLQTYDGLDSSSLLTSIDDFILGVFCFEIIVKVIAESSRPWLFLTGDDWRWNWFDTLIVVFCLPIPGFFEDLNPSFLRLMRLARITKLFKKIPQLQVIVSGLVVGLKSIVWVMLLLLLIYYLFGVCAVLLFKENAAWHFGNVPISMISLFRSATLENWSQLMYINYYGCGDYTAEYSDGRPESSRRVDRPERGNNSTKVRIDVYAPLNYQHVFYPPLCTSSVGKPVLSVLFFLSFTVIASFVMLSLFVGAVTMGMADSISEQSEAKKDKEREQLLLHAGANEQELRELLAQVWDRFDAGLLTTLRKAQPLAKFKRAASAIRVNLFYLRQAQIAPGDSDNVLSQTFDGAATGMQGLEHAEDIRTKMLFGKREAEKGGTPGSGPFRNHKGNSNSSLRAPEVANMARHIEATTADSEKKRQEEEDRLKYPGIRRKCGRVYLRLSARCQRIEVNALFNNFITLAILIASVMVGLGTEPQYDDVEWLIQLESVILVVFIFECVLKITARGSRPLDYLNDPWNVFDFVIVLASVAPLVLTVGSFASIVKVFRLLRLLRIFKLAKQFKQLRIIVEALVKGFSSITYISLILFIFYYVFAIVAMLLFKVNDPHHFGNLHIALLSLFRAATMDDWTDLMYINMFGCDRYGYETMPFECVAPEGWGYFSCVYFVAFVLLGAQILLSLFIGVVTTAMAEAELESKRADKMDRDIKVIVKREGLSEEDIACAWKLFAKLDIDEEGSISFGELEALFRILGQLSEDLTEKQVLELFEECDDDQSGVLEFPEFVSLLMMVHKKVLTLAERKGLRDKSRIRQQEVVFEMKALQLVHRAESGDQSDVTKTPLGSVITSSGAGSAIGRNSSSSSTPPTTSSESPKVLPAKDDVDNVLITMELKRELAAAEARVAALAVAKAKLLATQVAMDHRAAGKVSGLKIAPGLPP